MYVQCTLEKGNSQQTSWIPKKFAKLDGVLKLKSEDGKWDNGWVVILVGTECEDTPDWRKSVRNHKKRTGDSLPKEPKDA